MQDNLVIVESPAKAKTIEKFLGKDFKVMSSYGHIRDLKKKELSIDSDTLQPEYEIPADKQKVVKDLKAHAQKATKVWLASDEDREGEAISWHLCEVLGLDKEKTARIVFHEITKQAILKAIEEPRHINMNLVNAQQARRLLDRLVGFKLSPVLWRKVKPSLSAGRVQSVAVRLVVDREREIQAFQSQTYYRVSALFTKSVGEENYEMKADLDSRFSNPEDALAFLEKCKDATFTVNAISKKPVKRMPAPPFTTSTLQQEAARKLGLSVSQIMMIAQRLYESGLITYMRTDSVNLSALALNTAKQVITDQWGGEYSRLRNFHTSSKGAQEAHEAIRPTYMENTSIEGTPQERRLYELIWKRTVASQMAEAELEKTTVGIDISNCPSLHFTATGEVVVFDGFLKVYRESNDDENASQPENDSLLPPIAEGDQLLPTEITSTQRFTQGPQRYNEASLVHKMEELGIGRPSTYAPTISTIQQREYVVKNDRKGEERVFTISSLKNGKITTKTKKEVAGKEKGKLVPTDIGMVVNDFLLQNFEDIMDYNFTARVEEQFDAIAEGREDWNGMMKGFDKNFEPVVNRVMNSRTEHKVGERQVGIDPASGKPVFVKIGRFGPLAQIGTNEDKEKPRFAHLPSDKSIETITLEETLELFRLPRTLGQFEGCDVVIGSGRFGPYVLHNKKFASIPKGEDPLAVTLEEAIMLIEEKRKADSQKHLKTFAEDSKLEVLNGRYGPYIAYDGKNYRLPKTLHAKVSELTYEQCMEIVNASEKPQSSRKKS